VKPQAASRRLLTPWNSSTSSRPVSLCRSLMHDKGRYVEGLREKPHIVRV
jgi:hypothetical protein